MGWALGIGVYFLVWWLMLTAVLPWGVRTQMDTGEIVPGSERSAPVKPQIWRKVVANTIVSAVVWLIVDALYIYFYLGDVPSF